MKIRFRLSILLAFVIFSGALVAQSGPSAALLVLSKQDHTLAIVDSINACRSLRKRRSATIPTK